MRPASIASFASFTLLVALSAQAHAQGEPAPASTEPPALPPATSPPGTPETAVPAGPAAVDPSDGNMAAAPAPAAEPSKTEHGHFAMRAAVGAAYRKLYEVPIWGGDVQLGFGAQWHEVAIYGTLGALYGSTQHGMLTRAYELGFSVELREGRFGLGAALRSSYMYVVRATDGTVIDGTGIGVAPFISFDLLEVDQHALYLNAKVNLDSFGGTPTAFVWGPTLSLGFRY